MSKNALRNDQHKWTQLAPSKHTHASKWWKEKSVLLYNSRVYTSICVSISAGQTHRQTPTHTQTKCREKGLHMRGWGG